MAPAAQAALFLESPFEYELKYALWWTHREHQVNISMLSKTASTPHGLAELDQKGMFRGWSLQSSKVLRTGKTALLAMFL